MDFDYVSVGKHKGEWDFRINATIMNLPYEEVKQLREVMMVAIGTAEDMIRQGQMKQWEQKHGAAKTDESSL
jgi:hypothetical protein